MFEEYHQCKAIRDGDWIIWQCEHEWCEFERRYNWRTGEMRVLNDKPTFHHFGSYAPKEYMIFFESLN